MAGLSSRTIHELVQEWVLRETSQLPHLPQGLETELKSFQALSDESLALIAHGTLNQKQQEQLEYFNAQSNTGQITENEREEQDNLVDIYQKTVLRRAEAAGILRQRGRTDLIQLKK